MFLVLIIPAFLSPCFVPTAHCESLKSRLNLSKLGNGSVAIDDIIFAPFTPTIPKLYLLQSEFPELFVSPDSYDLALEYKNDTRKDSQNNAFSKRHAPVRVPRVRHSKDYGKSSHYRMKGRNEGHSGRKAFYMSLLQKLLRPGTSRKGKNYYSSSSSGSKYSSAPVSYTSVSSGPMEAAAGGWGWSGWGKGGGHHGISLVDLLLCGFSLLSLGGFLLNLLLNLLNMFGMGMFTTTSTYPVTVTQTQTATGTATSTGGGTTSTGGTAVTYPAALTASAVGTGWGITGRTIHSMAGGWGGRKESTDWKGESTDWKGSKGTAWKGSKGSKGWGWGSKSSSKLSGHIKFGGDKHTGPGWTTTTTTTTTTAPPTYTGPTLTGSTGGTGGLLNVASLFANGRKKRRKRETFQPYVNPSTALNIFAKAMLNSIGAAANKFECIDKIFCENNKQARVIGQWLDYFMPVYSFSLSYFGHRVGAHESLVDHIRAIVLGVTETNCQAHFPRCSEPTHP